MHKPDGHFLVTRKCPSFESTFESRVLKTRKIVYNKGMSETESIPESIGQDFGHQEDETLRWTALSRQVLWIR